jgi:hypothetical protein
MAHPSLTLITALLRTAARLREGAEYQWGHLGMCNCGHLAQTITARSRREIHEAALERGGEWADRVREYCPSSGHAIDAIIDELLALGLTSGELADLEHLADDRVLRRLPPERRHLVHNSRDDVVLYLETWAELVREQLGAQARASEPPASAPAPLLERAA